MWMKHTHVYFCSNLVFVSSVCFSSCIRANAPFIVDSNITQSPRKIKVKCENVRKIVKIPNENELGNTITHTHRGERNERKQRHLKCAIKAWWRHSLQCTLYKWWLSNSNNSNDKKKCDMSGSYYWLGTEYELPLNHSCWQISICKQSQCDENADEQRGQICRLECLNCRTIFAFAQDNAHHRTFRLPCDSRRQSFYARVSTSSVIIINTIECLYAWRFTGDDTKSFPSVIARCF